MADGKFLAELTASLVETATNDPPRTADFVDTMSKTIPVFDHLGSVLSFAKTDMVKKNESLKEASARLETLGAVVEADKKSNKVIVKDSLARNLHRLRTVIVFMDQILTNLETSPTTTLTTAVSSAYAETLAPYHGMVIRATCNAGFLLLPSRASFLESLGETGAISRVIRSTATTTCGRIALAAMLHPSEESAVVHIAPFTQAAQKVISSVDRLYDVKMPPSSSWM